MLPASVPRFWICTPPTSRAASFRPSNCGGSSARDDVAPGGERADAPARRLLGDAAQVGHGGDVEHVVVAHVAPAGARRLGRIDIGAAGQHRHRAAPARIAERFLERARGGDRRPSRSTSVTSPMRRLKPLRRTPLRVARASRMRRRRRCVDGAIVCAQRRRTARAPDRACSSRGRHRGRPAQARARTDRRSRRLPASSPRRGRPPASGMSWSFDRCSGMSVSPPRCTRTTLGAPSPPPCTPGGPKRPWSITNEARASPRSSSTS